MVRLRRPDDRLNFAAPRVEVLGLFASGKSSLVHRLCSRGASRTLPEAHERIAAWGHSLLNERLGFLPYDVAFLLQHIELAALAPNFDGLHACDWSFVTDRLWARLRLSQSEFAAYTTLADALQSKISKCNRYVYLRATPQTVMSRLAMRAREHEDQLSLTEIELAAHELDQEVGKLRDVKVLNVNAELPLDYVVSEVTAWLRQD